MPFSLTAADDEEDIPLAPGNNKQVGADKSS